MNTIKSVQGVAEGRARYDVDREGALMQQLGDRLRLARGKRSRSEVARYLRVHENTVAKLERGETSADLWHLQQMAELTGRSFAWLVGLEDQAQRVAPSAISVEADGQIHVPVFDLRAATARGGFTSAADVLAMRGFNTDYIRRDLNIGHMEMAVVEVVGRGMEPLIGDGDVVLVDLRDTSVAVEGPHLVLMDGTPMVKLLERRPGGRLRVRSKNPEFEPFEVDPANEAGGFQVLGRVRWGGVTFR